MIRNGPTKSGRLQEEKVPDIIVDVAGGSSLPKSISACANGGFIGLIGVLAGVTSEISTIDILRRQLTIRGIFMESTEELRAFARACEATRLQPVIDKVFSFSESQNAYRYFAISGTYWESCDKSAILIMVLVKEPFGFKRVPNFFNWHPLPILDRIIK